MSFTICNDIIILVINMIFSATKTLTDTVCKYVPLEKLNVKFDTFKSFFGAEYDADFVEILTESSDTFSFEVSENEIIIFFFNDHIHFEDYAFDLEDGEHDYVQRADEFLNKLFTLPIEIHSTFKGNKNVSSESFFITEKGRESCAGKAVWSAGLKNVLKKKTKRIETKIFDRTLAKFVNAGCKELSMSEIAERMYNKSLDCFTGKVLKVIYSENKTERYVILKNENGIIHFVFEKIELYDEETLNYFEGSPDALPAYWNGFDTPRSFYGTLEDALNNLKFEPKYRQYFE